MTDDTSIATSSSPTYTSIAAIRALQSLQYRNIHEWHHIPVDIIDIITSYARSPLLMVFAGTTSSSINHIWIGQPFDGDTCHWYPFVVPTRGVATDKTRDRYFAMNAALFHGAMHDAAIIVCGAVNGSADMASLAIHTQPPSLSSLSADDASPSSSVWRTSSSLVNPLPRLNYGRSSEAALITLDNGQVAIIGGDSSSFFHTGSSSERWTGNSWTSGPSTHFTRNHVAATCVPYHGSGCGGSSHTSGDTSGASDAEVWLCAGLGAKSATKISAIERLRTSCEKKDTNDTTRSGDMLSVAGNNGSHHHVMCTVGTAVLVMGGMNDSNVYHTTVERCEPSVSTNWHAASWTLPATQRFSSAHYIADDDTPLMMGTLILVGAQSLWYTRLARNGRTQVGTWHSIRALPRACDAVTSVLIP